MENIARMSPAQEQRLMRALESAGGYLEQGNSAVEALTKAAQQHDLPRGHIEPIVHAFNAAQALQKQAAGSYAERAAEYELIDPQTIVQALFPTTQKKAAFTGVSDEYDLPPVWLNPPKPPVLEKRASTLEISTTSESRAARAQQFCDYAEKALENTASELTRVENEANHYLQKLAAYFGPHGYIPGNIPADAVRDNAYRKWGTVAAKIIDSVTTVKAAGFRHVHPVSETAEPYCDILKVAALLKDLPAQREAYKAACARHQAWIDKNPQLFSNWGRTPPAVEKKASGLNLSQVLGVSLAKDWAEGLAGQMRQAEPEALVQKELGQLSSPEHETELRDISQRAMLQDILVNDPVLSRHEPHDIANAFNSLSMLAPEAMTNPELATGLLRKRMEAGGLEPFELQGLTSIDNTLRQPRNKPQDKPSPQSA